VSKEDSKSRLFERLEPEIARHGFKLIKGRGAFERDRGDVIDLYKLGFYSSSKGTRIQPEIIMRYPEMDRIYHEVSGAKPADRKFHAPISFAVWRVFGGVQQKYEFLLGGNETVEPVAASILSTFHETALPYFESHSTIADVDRAFNETPNTMPSLLQNADTWTRLAFATIAAKLVKNPKYDSIVQTYKAFIKKADGGEDSKRYQSLLKLLEEQA
jgi:hypothetical protein